MKKQIATLIKLILNILLLGIGVYIFIYYITTSTIEGLRSLPPYFLISILGYILLQLIKRNVLKESPWYNWLYYIGLLTIVLPLPFSSIEGNWIFTATRIGPLFLLIPPLIDILLHFQKREKLEKNALNKNE